MNATTIFFSAIAVSAVLFMASAASTFNPDKPMGNHKNKVVAAAQADAELLKQFQ